MKNLILVLVLSCVTSFLYGQKAVEISFDTELIELGSVKKGDKKSFVYNFTNTGTDDIEIDLISSCECTTLNWTKGKIGPGEKGKIEGIFDSTTKDKSETISVEMYLTNIDPRIDANYLYMLEYTYVFEK